MKKSIAVVVGVFVVLVCLVVIFAVSFPIKHRKVIEDVSKKYNLDVGLILAVINVESGWDTTAVSRSGAVGVMQIMPSTADEFATKLGYTQFDLTDFSDNVDIGCCYLRYLLDLFGDKKLALCAYNAGLKNVREWLENPEYCTDGKLVKLPYKETRDYVKKVDFNKRVYDILF